MPALRPETQGAASPPLRRVSPVHLRLTGAVQRRVACFMGRINSNQPPLVSDCCVFIQAFIAFSFYVSYKRVSARKLQLSSLSLPPSQRKLLPAK